MKTCQRQLTVILHHHQNTKRSLSITILYSLIHKKDATDDIRRSEIPHRK